MTIRAKFWAAFRVALTVPTLGLCATSAYFAYHFGGTLAHDPSMILVYAVACLAIDLIKAPMTFLAAASPTRAGRVSAWAVFAFATAMSILAAFVNLSTQTAERAAEKSVAGRNRDAAEKTLRELESRRAKRPEIVKPVSAGTVQASRDAAVALKAQIDAECRDGRGPKCTGLERQLRDKNAEVSQLQEAKDIYDEVASIDDKIAAAKKDVEDKTDAKAEVVANPFVARMTKITGIDPDHIELAQYGLMSTALELVAGLGLIVLWPHGAGARRLEVEPDRIEVAADVSEVKAPVLLAPAAPTAHDIRQKFFDDCVRGAKDATVTGKAMHAAYVIWCEQLGAEPMSIQAFGLNSPWTFTKRTNAGRRYDHCTLVPELARAVAAAEPKPVAPKPEPGKPQLRLVSHNLAPA
jgi:hypothetical protein